MPSPLKSPLATPIGSLPVPYVCCGRKLDRPGPASPTLPKFTSVVRSVKLAVPVGAGNPNPNTEAVKSQFLPSAWSVRVVMVGSVPVTVSCCEALLFAYPKELFGLYCAVTSNTPGANLVFSVAVPAFTNGTVANTWLPLKKLTVPTVTLLPLPVTVAVSVTTSRAVAGSGATVNAVFVGTAEVLFSNIDTVLVPWFAVTKSGLPSRLKYPTATKLGLAPTPKGPAAWKVPSPLPSSTLTLALPLFATATSSLPSPLKSPTATELGLWPAPGFVAAWKVPSPLPSSTLTLLLLPFAVTRSSLPSPLKSPTATPTNPVPAPAL